MSENIYLPIRLQIPVIPKVLQVLSMVNVLRLPLLCLQ